MKTIKIDKRVERIYKESQVMVLVESLTDNIKIIAESQQGLIERVDRMEKNMNERFDRLEIRLDSLELRVSELESRLREFKNETTRNFKFFFEHICRLEDDINDIRQKAEMAKKEKNTAEVKRLEQRLEKLEKDFAKHKACNT